VTSPTLPGLRGLIGLAIKDPSTETVASVGRFKPLLMLLASAEYGTISAYGIGANFVAEKNSGSMIGSSDRFFSISTSFEGITYIEGTFGFLLQNMTEANTPPITSTPPPMAIATI